MSPSEPEGDHITIQHFAAFGGIVQSFAQLEWVIQITIAAISGIDVSKVVILTKELSYRQKRDTLYSYMEIGGFYEEHKAQIKGFLDKVDEHNTLRNNIAHAIWKPGKRKGSIQPMNLIVRGGKGRIVGAFETSERDYTAFDLAVVADQLRMIHNSYVDFMRRSGLMADIDEKISKTIDSMTDLGTAQAK